MSEELKQVEELVRPEPEEVSEVEEDVEDVPGEQQTAGKKKKKNKKKKKAATAAAATSVAEVVDNGEGSSTAGAGRKEKEVTLPSHVVDQLLKNNPSLAAETKGLEGTKLEEMLRGLKMEDLLTGMAPGKNQKDMASYKFWATQPVARFDEEEAMKPDGPVRLKNPEVVPLEGAELLPGFEWVTMDLTDENQMQEVYELLSGHYVEDQEAMFRFKYSPSFLNWALKSPGWIKEWHVGVRVTASKKLVAFISGIPVNLKVRANVIRCSEINFLCIHKKLRSKRLAPVLIKEITRRCNVEKIWNAIYTAGVVLPKPISTCRYYHRSLDWLKLHDVGFSPLPVKSTKSRQVTKYSLPMHTKCKGLREMEAKDIDAVHSLLTRYLERFDMAPKFEREEVDHWLLHKETAGTERVVWTYVIEEAGRITDFFSFYSLDSSVIGNKKHDMIRAAYMFYYASETAFSDSADVKKELKIRLNELMNDALILAKKYNFDVFNALTLLDNTLFLEEQKFGPGDGQLHFYLFNWRTAHIKGGIDEHNKLDEKNGSGIGIVML
ncbi:glycylpeptide N-tetradecanoyltransferase [Rhizina undulata]